MTVQQLKEGIEKIDAEIKKHEAGSIEWMTQKRNRQFLVNQIFQMVGMTELLKLDVLENPTV